VVASKDLIFTVLGIDNASTTFDKVGDSMDKMGSRATKTLLGVAAASAGSAAVIAAATAAAPLMFVAIGAAAVSETERVRDAVGSLGATVRNGLAQDAAPMADAFVGATGRMSAAFTSLRPEMREAFSASIPAVYSLTDGVIAFARNAMPGALLAVQRSGPVFQGLEGFLGSAGTAMGDFFEVTSTGAEDAGQGLEHFGTLLEEVLPAAGGLMVTMAGLWAEHGDQAARVIGQLVGLVDELGGSAMPIASTAMGTALDVLEGLLTVLEPMSGVLGPLIGMWLLLGTTMKGIHAVKGVVDGIGDSVGTFRERMASAGGPSGAGRLATGVGSVMNALGGPWGIAIAAAGLALALFGQESQEAAADQRSLSAALKESAGAFDANARRAIVNSEGYKEVSDKVNRAGMTHKEIVDTLIAGGPAFDNLKTKLDQQVEAGTKWTTANGATSKSLTDKAQASGMLRNNLDNLRETVTGSIADYERERDALGESASAMTKSLPGAASLREAIQMLGKDTADTSDKVSALDTAWRRLFGTTLNLEDATAGWEAGLDKLSSTIADAKKEVLGWDAELFNSNGTVNIATERGRELQASLSEQGRSYRELAQTTYDTALQQGKSHADATAAVVAATAERRAQFVDEWIQMTDNAQQAQELADRYFGIPGDVRTLITDPGAAEAIARAIQLRDRVLAVPERWIVTTEAEVGVSIQALRDLGLVVTTLPEGKIKVEAPNVGAVGSQIDYAARDRTSIVTVQANYGGSAYSGQGYSVGQATGGFYDGHVVEKYAGGGMRGLTPMLGNMAAIVAPNAKRVIGDNPRFKEAYIPINNSAASQAYLAQTANEMGYDLVARGSTASAGSVGYSAQRTSVGGERHYHLHLTGVGNTEVDLRTQFEQLELLAMPESG